MIGSDVIIFGCDEYALQLAKNLQGYCQSLKIFTMHEEKVKFLQSKGLDAGLFNVNENWEVLSGYDPARLIAYSAIGDEAENIFLTISLRTSFKDMAIFALATDRQNAIKLRAAGANKTIVTAQIAANTITEMLDKPTASSMMQKLLGDTGQLQVAQIVVSSESSIVGKKVKEIDFERQFDVVVIAIIDKELQSIFTFTKKGINHPFEEGDIIVAIAYDKVIAAFEKSLGRHLPPDWHYWRR